MKEKYLLSKAIGLLTVLLTLLSCEDIIYPTLESASPVLVVDAWINNQSATQEIVLTQSQPYFENVIPTGVTGAVVSIVDNHGKVFSFVSSDNKPGYYRWTPLSGEVFGTVGDSYTLTILAGGETFVSSSYMGRVPVIDSITFQTDSRVGSSEMITRAEFWSTDPPGIGDAYWIRTFKNGLLLNKPSELNIAFDAGLSIGGQSDGVTFITPIRRRINPNEQDVNGNQLNPISKGDSLQVQINSITPQAFTYLNEVSIQTDRPGGFQELFATPLANVSTNIKNINANGSKVLGFFNVAAVSVAGKRFVE